MPRVKRSRTDCFLNTSRPSCANELRYLTGYQDTASGGLSFGDQAVKCPTNVYTVDRAFRDARTPKKDPVCEVGGCDKGATYGANNPKALAKRCPAHRKETDVSVMCAVAGCTEKVRLVRAGAAEPVCIFHADHGETVYVTARGTDTCICGKRAEFGAGRSKMVCGRCAEVLNRVLGTPLVCVLSGNCGVCAKVQGNDILIRKSDGEKLTVCRPCYNAAKPEEYTRGQRYKACHRCGKHATLKCDEDGHFACSRHTRPGKTYSYSCGPCRAPGCEKQAKYATDYGATPVACGVHRKENEHNVTNTRCRTCLAAALRWYHATLLTGTRARMGICGGCEKDGDGPKRQFYEQTICAAIAIALDEAGVEYTAVLDKVLDMYTTKDRRRPDAVFRFRVNCKKKTVFAEVDEGQHRRYTCDTKREADLFASVEDLDAEKLMIRINPDMGGAANSLFSGKPTINELNEGRKPLEFITPRFNEKITETVSLIREFLDDQLEPGHVYHINWTTHAPPRKVEYHS